MPRFGIKRKLHLTSSKRSHHDGCISNLVFCERNVNPSDVGNNLARSNIYQHSENPSGVGSNFVKQTRRVNPSNVPSWIDDTSPSHDGNEFVRVVSKTL